jgi:hypothetical protein
VVCNSEGIAGRLTSSIADEVAIRGSFLRSEVIAQCAIEALEANVAAVLFLSLANLRAATVTAHDVHAFSFFIHRLFLLSKTGISFLPQR